MCDDDEAEFYTLLVHTCQACQPNAKPLTVEAMNMIFEDLRDYPLELVKKALQAHRRDKDRGQWLPNAAHIEHQIDMRRVVKWIAADEAWAKMPKVEGQPALLNDVTVQALAAAQPFLDQMHEGADGRLTPRPDMVAARMAFKGCFERLVERAKLEKRVPKYFVSPGGSYEEQQVLIDESVRLGLLAPPKRLQQLAHDTGSTRSAPPPEFKALLLNMQGKTMPPPEAEDYER